MRKQDNHAPNSREYQQRWREPLNPGGAITLWNHELAPHIGHHL